MTKTALRKTLLAQRGSVSYDDMVRFCQIADRCVAFIGEDSRDDWEFLKGFLVAEGKAQLIDELVYEFQDQR